MAKTTKEKTIKASKLVSFLEKHKHEPVNFSISKKDIQLNVRGEVHKHDEQFWITSGEAKTIVELKQAGSWLSKLLNWPDKDYHASVTIMLSGETIAKINIPMHSKEKLSYWIE